MIVVGVCVVRDGADVLELSLRHHLATACDRVVVVDTGSTDGSDALVQRLASDGLAVELRREPDAERATVVTAVAREAHAAGAAWVVPFDAHQLWCDRAGQALRPVLVSTAAGDLQATVVPFAQDRGATFGEPASLTLPAASLAPEATGEQTPLAAHAGVASVLRPSDEVSVDAEGRVSGARGWTEHSPWVTVLSLPIRSARAAGGDEAWARSTTHDGRLEGVPLRSDVRWAAAAWRALQGVHG